MNELSDNEHMHRLAAGEIAHLAPLYRRWQPKVVALCYGMVGDSTDAADLTHEVFLRLVRYRHTFRGDASFGSWLYTMARRVCLDHVNQNHRRRRALDTVQSDLAIRTPSVGDERLRRVRRAFEQLESDQREVLVLHRIYGLKYREIADLLNSSEGAVRVRAHRALNALRERLQGLEPS